MTFIVFLIFLSCILLVVVKSQKDFIPLKQLDFNWYIDVWMNNAMYSLVVDTSTTIFTLKFNDDDFDTYKNANNTETNRNCIFLSVDQGLANFTTSAFTSGLPLCIIGNDTTSISTTTTSTTGINITTSQSLFTGTSRFHSTNNILHSWQLGNGLLGLNHPSTYNPSTYNYLHTILKSYSNKIIALDFNSISSSSLNSYMTLGGYDSNTYKDSLSWQTQAISSYHAATISDLELCGNSLFGNWSSTWSLMFDTSASCLTLPLEFYDIFETWLNTAELTNANIDKAPPISFIFTGIFANSTDSSSSSTGREMDRRLMKIRLSDLIVPAAAINGEPGAPTLVTGERICVLRGGSASRAHTFNPIIVGALPLKSLYFVADFDNATIGMANKGSFPTQQEIDTTGGCAVSKESTCIGSQNYNDETNSCTQPNCHKYFFVKLDDSSQECIWNTSAYGAGAFFIILFTLAETVAYFVGAYSGSIITGGNVDVVSFKVGQAISNVIDLMIVHIFHWVEEDEDNNSNNNGTANRSIAIDHNSEAGTEMATNNTNLNNSL